MKPSARFLACAAVCFVLSACNYDFPLTAKPTRKLDERLVGDWVSTDPDTKKLEVMHVRQQDDTTYLVAFDDDNYAVTHSDLGDLALLSVQELRTANRRFLYMQWQLTEKGHHLTLRAVSNKVVPDKTPTAAAAQTLIKKNAKNPALFADPVEFRKR